MYRAPAPPPRPASHHPAPSHHGTPATLAPPIPRQCSRGGRRGPGCEGTLGGAIAHPSTPALHPIPPGPHPSHHSRRCASRSTPARASHAIAPPPRPPRSIPRQPSPASAPCPAPPPPRPPRSIPRQPSPASLRALPTTARPASHHDGRRSARSDRTATEWSMYRALAPHLAPYRSTRSAHPTMSPTRPSPLRSPVSARVAAGAGRGAKGRLEAPSPIPPPPHYIPSRPAHTHRITRADARPAAPRPAPATPPPYLHARREASLGSHRRSTTYHAARSPKPSRSHPPRSHRGPLHSHRAGNPNPATFATNIAI